MKSLLIVESPGKIKKLKEYLGPGWEVKASIGHICDLPKKELGIDKNNGFKLSYQVSDDKKDVVKGLSTAVKNIGKDNVYLATDPDREGEAISFHLCRNLGLDYKTAKRVTFQEITKSVIVSAVANPRLINLALVSAQEARRAIDRLVGFEISPILWRKIKSDTALSAGRVQSVAVKLIVEREREIINFGSTYTFKISGIFQTPEKNRLKATATFDFQNLDASKEYLKSTDNKNFEIKSVVKEPHKKHPQAPFSTSTLQQDANKKLKFSVDKTMQVAQKLYEGGHITYMRTDSVNLSQTAIDLLSDFIKQTYGEEYLENRKFKNKNESAQEAHEAIRPSHFDVKDIEGTEDEKALYNLIYLRAVASQMRAKETDVTTITINTNEGKDEFKAKAAIIKFDGFTKAYSEIEDEEKENEDEELEIREPLKAGDMLILNSVTAKQSYTKPKSRFGEAELVKELEALGIGRPSTYASIMRNIKDVRKYVSVGKTEGKKLETLVITYQNGSFKEQKGSVSLGQAKDKLIPNPIAFDLVDFLQKGFTDIMDYKFTAACEDNFDRVADGKEKYASVVESFSSQLSKSIADVDGKYTDIEGKERKTIDIGEYEKKVVSVGKGEHGVYVRHNEKFYNVPGVDDFNTVTLENAITTIKEKREAEKKKKEEISANTLRVIGKFKIIQGQFGPYVTNGTDKASVPKWDLEKIAEYDEQKCKDLIKNYKAYQKKKK